ncbi:DUF4350 domain-containing protein [Demequina sediminicola]|uniref:DUF4350 domain-containing protein n=1 Tax=Demequina sediminicola TaxID=1095026 RepID=UPI0007853A4A|nr:DUF4350 domain-containing protein [Demequina sediminicola]
MTTEAHTRVAARPGAVATLRKHPLVVAGVLLAFILLGVLAVMAQPTDERPLSPANPGSDGARAVAQLLGEHGVDVSNPQTLSATNIQDPGSTTLIVSVPSDLQSYQIDALMEYPGDLVFLGADRTILQSLGITDPDISTYVADGRTDAQCDDADALAAGTINVTAGFGTHSGAAQYQACFTTPDGYSAYLVAPRDSGTVRIIGSTSIVTNEHLTEEGHAALALRALSHQDAAVWYVADIFDSSVPTWLDDTNDLPPSAEVEADADMLPPWFIPMLFMLGLTVLMAGLWRGRRFGPLVPEPLPVIVPGAEAVRGRARLYRRARAAHHAAAALRASTASRMGARLGVPRSGTMNALIDAVHSATGIPRDHVARTLGGPPPSNDAELIDLIADLDALESEVHRP